MREYGIVFQEKSRADIVSVGMFEHVGYKNYRTYMEVASQHLKDGRLFLFRTIGNKVSAVNTDPL